MKKILLLSFLALNFNAIQAMFVVPESPEEIKRISDFYADKPGTFLLACCCPIYTIYGLNLLIKIGEKYAPSDEQKVKMVQCVTSCYKKMNSIPAEFVRAHDNGLVKTLFDKSPKQIKME